MGSYGTQGKTLQKAHRLRKIIILASQTCNERRIIESSRKSKCSLKMSATFWKCKQSLKIFGTEIFMLGIKRRSAGVTQKQHEQDAHLFFYTFSLHYPILNGLTCFSVENHPTNLENLNFQNFESVFSLHAIMHGNAYKAKQMS